MVPLRSHASVRSYYFREALSERTTALTWSDARCYWRTANAKAFEWRRRATNIWNDQTKQWEQRT